jgi:hypothetical protein
MYPISPRFLGKGSTFNGGSSARIDEDGPGVAMSRIISKERVELVIACTWQDSL